MYVGYDSNYQSNTPCPGGPFAYPITSDYGQFSSHGKGTEWVNGAEAWCNLEGKYVSFVREATAQPVLDEIILCSFGVITDPVAVLPSVCTVTSIQNTNLTSVAIDPDGEETLISFDPWIAHGSPSCSNHTWEYKAYFNNVEI